MSDSSKQKTGGENGGAAHHSSGNLIAALAFYGPDNRLATKVTAAIIDANRQIVAQKKWFASSKTDVRQDEGINHQIAEFVASYAVMKVIMTDHIIGCPHEAGLDYPQGETCPKCRYWSEDH